MSDDDFVTKPLRTYKRRRRAAPHIAMTTHRAPPLAPIEPPISPKNIIGPELCNSVAVSPNKTTRVSHTACNKLTAVAVHAGESDSVEMSGVEMSDLDAFLSSKSDVLGRSVFEETCFPELEIETVLRDEDEEVICGERNKMPTCPTDEKVPVKEQIANIKMATKSLCDSVNGRNLKQSSLFGVLRGGKTTSHPDTVVAGCRSDPKERDDNTENQSTANKNEKEKSLLISDQSHKKSVALSKAPLRASLLTNAPKVPLQPKKLIKQAGTSQLDLGAMFGLKPKHTAPVETKPEKSTKRKVPYHKWVRGTSFTVDAFNFGDIPKCTAYFLSHFHADHYIGLNKHFTGLLYCSKVTSNFVLNNLKVSPDRVKTLQFDRTEVIQGIKVSLITANHCPGSAMFLFESPTIGTVLHTGDFRYSRQMLQHPLLKDKSLDLLYLDTTYMDPVYRFPRQEEVIQYMTGEILQLTPDTLIVCGAYTIGKERLVEGIAKVLNCKICVTQTKMDLIKMQENKGLTTRLTKSLNSRVHIVPMKDINPGSLSKLLARTTFSTVVGVKPTGWNHSQNTRLADIRPSGSGKVRIYSVPYSEHSSYCELEEFVRSVSVKKIISTVIPRGEEKRKVMFEKLKQWTSE